jgi:hypothetical protein
MQEHAGNLMAKLRELEATAKELEDELAESEVRKGVGELSANEFDSMAKKAQRELARLDDDRDRIADDLNHIREILGARATKDDDAPRTSADFDELEFLKSVVGASTPARSEPAAKPVVRATPTGTAAAPAAPAPAPPSLATPSKSAPAVPAEPSPALTPATVAATPIETPSDGPLAIRPSGGMEQPKTLKCAECGSMNYSSEWYCERCGGELAAI